MFCTINKEARVNSGLSLCVTDALIYVLRLVPYLLKLAQDINVSPEGHHLPVGFRATCALPLTASVALFVFHFLISNYIIQFVYKYATSYKQAVSSLT